MRLAEGQLAGTSGKALRSFIHSFNNPRVPTEHQAQGMDRLRILTGVTIQVGETGGK